MKTNTKTASILKRLGFVPYKPAHKTTCGASLGEIRSLNKYFRESDDWWVSPKGEILHYSQCTTKNPLAKPREIG